MKPRLIANMSRGSEQSQQELATYIKYPSLIRGLRNISSMRACSGERFGAPAQFTTPAKRHSILYKVRCGFGRLVRHICYLITKLFEGEFNENRNPMRTARTQTVKSAVHRFFRSEGCRQHWTRPRRALFCVGCARAGKNVAWPCWIELVPLESRWLRG